MSRRPIIAESPSGTTDPSATTRRKTSTMYRTDIHAGQGRTALLLRLTAAFLIVCGSLGIVFGGSASASTLDGVATITSPGTAAALTSGGSNTLFTVALPANAACSGDTATGGYHIYSYLVPQPTGSTTVNSAVTAVTFTSGVPSAGVGLFTATGSYYGPANTDITTGKIFGIPNNFQWAQLISTAGETAAQLTANKWEGGIACADTHGAVSDYWNTEVTFTASTTDANGFTWSAVAGDPSTTPTTSTTTSSTTTSPTTTSPTTTSTTVPGPTTTTTPGGTIFTTTNGGGTTTTLPPGAATTNSGTGTPSGGTPSSGGSVAASSGTTSGSGGNLAFTGFPITKGVGLGLFGVGLGFILMSWAPRRRLAHAHSGTGRSPIR